MHLYAKCNEDKRRIELVYLLTDLLCDIYVVIYPGIYVHVYFNTYFNPVMIRTLERVTGRIWKTTDGCLPVSEEPD